MNRYTESLRLERMLRENDGPYDLTCVLTWAVILVTVTAFWIYLFIQGGLL